MNPLPWQTASIVFSLKSKNWSLGHDSVGVDGGMAAVVVALDMLEADGLLFEQQTLDGLLGWLSFQHEPADSIVPCRWTADSAFRPEY